MKKISFIFLGLIFGPLVSSVRAEEIICHGKVRGFSIESPEGWVVDRSEGKKRSICAFLYPPGYNFNTAPLVVYPRHFEDEKGKANLKEFIKDDLKEFKQEARKMKVKETSLPKSLKKTGFVMKTLINGPAPNNFEDILYYSKAESVFIIVSSAAQKKFLEQYRSALLNMAESLKEIDIQSIEKLKTAAQSSSSSNSEEKK
jgi:hypothetical protein